MLKLHSPLSGRIRRAAVATAVATAAATLALLGTAAPAGAVGHVSHTHVSHTVDITAVEPLAYTVDTHGTLEAGYVHVAFRNQGHVAHQAQLFRLNDGVTYAQWLADLHGPNPNAAFFTDAAPTGGATPVVPGARQDVWGVLSGGTYVVACFVPGPGGVPHVLLGMYQPFEVVGSVPAWAQQLAPAFGRPAWASIQAHDLTYTMPPSLVRGALIRFDDTDSADVHELNLGKLLPGKTVDDAKGWFAASANNPLVDPGPPPFTFEGGYGAVVPGQGGWFRVEADPGRYIAFCLVPDDETGKSHASMGMVTGFTVLAD
ncbi:hypothetical protein GCM10009839_92990 [Catenulispora yoronensis]|uniref:Uncharacterized protein n=1 Tax=Catenulispora yoronensis TaxID=450799 RepID=A0ABN2VNF5_9ACTN